MTRVGLIAAVIIIVVAAIFFGFRKAAREHAADATARAGSPPVDVRPRSAPTPTAEPAGGSAREPVVAPPRVRRISPEARAQLVSQIVAARTRRGERADAPSGSPEAPRELSKDYIRDQVRALVPLLTECYTQALPGDPDLAGRLVVKFAIGGEPAVGGVVEESAVDPTESTITDAGMLECVRETMYAAEFVAPAEGGRIVVHYPFEFSADR